MLGIIKRLLGIQDVDVSGLLSQGAVLVDVRTVQEYRAGHVKGAVNIPLSQIGKQTDKIRKYKQTVVTCCASGRRSGIAARDLQAAGIEAYNGGAWTKVRQIKLDLKSS